MKIREQRQDRVNRQGNPCPVKWSKEISAAWSRVGFSTSRPYILIIIIVAQVSWCERIWNDGRGSAGRRKGRRLVRFVQKRADGCLRGDNPRLVASSTTISFLVRSLSPLRPSLSLSTSSRRLRSGLRGPAVKGRDMLKGTLKRMPPDANCAVREQFALSAVSHEEWPRDDFSSTVARFVEIVVIQCCLSF